MLFAGYETGTWFDEMFSPDGRPRVESDLLVKAIESLPEGEFARLQESANAFAAQIRRVAHEDKQALEESGLQFSIYCLVGGQMENDDEPRLYLIYPQANWVEIGQGTPYHIIGSPGYGKPVLDRTLQYEDSMRFALKVGCLAFDSTRISAADVDFPIDVVLYFKDTGQLVERRFDKEDLVEITEGWQERLRNSVTNLPSEWLDRFFAEIDDTSSPKLPDMLRERSV
ncbi:MAG TPA: peptidase [Dehalococcoidia bacterium]|nr:peptidase [Dehalococcoidia bacterium]